MPRLLTGVSAVLSAAHNERATGKLHGHTWEITAWFVFDNTDQAVLQQRLQDIVGPLDHSLLPDNLAWGESLAMHIGWALGDATAVDVARPSDRIYARWEA